MALESYRGWNQENMQVSCPRLEEGNKKFSKRWVVSRLYLMYHMIYLVFFCEDAIKGVYVGEYYNQT